VGKLFKINAVNSDGSEIAKDKTIEFVVVDASTSKPFVGEDGQPSVVLTLKPISQSKYRQIVNERTERLLNKKTRQMEDATDWDKVQDDLVSFSIQSWKGLVGADDQPLQCVLDAKLALPGDLKNELVSRAMQGESVDSQASFRQPA
jgi:hypothetical protein